MKAVVLERQHEINLRDIEIPEEMGPDDVTIAVHTVGVCGSDVHYYVDGAIGEFIVNEPMVLGHEASGTVLEVGEHVTHLKPGDRVCMEPGVPTPLHRATREGMYNLDPGMMFWATPPAHGCLRPTVVHPSWLTFKLGENVSYGEGALVEPLAVGMHAVTKARIKPGDVAVVTGAGTIGLLTACAALAGGCSHVIISDVVQPKLDLAETLGPITAVNAKDGDLLEAVNDLTGGWGADAVFEASGSPKAIEDVLTCRYACPGGCLVMIGIPNDPVPFKPTYTQAKEVRIESSFRYAHMYPRSVALMESGKLDVKPFITDVYTFDKSLEAFEYAKNMKPASVKVQIVVDDTRS